MVKRLVVGVTLGVLLPVSAWAQAPQPRSAETEQAQARYKIFVMEGVLERAVQNGAAVLSRQVRSIAPDAMFLTGAAQVRGFRLDGYGVFFDVEVPALRPTVAWTLRAAMVDDSGASLARLKSFVQKIQEPGDRAELQRAIRQIELQMPGARPTPADAVAAGATGGGKGGDSGIAQAAAEQTATSPAPTSRQFGNVDPLLLSDPAAAYTREVKAALIDAMIENSFPLAIGADEWLTIAARDSEPGNRLVPGDSYDLTTWTFRVKGRDLAAYRSGQLTLEEMRKKVELREF